MQITSNSFRHIDDFFRAEIRISPMLSPLFMSGTPGIIFKFKLEFDIVFNNSLTCDNTTHRSRSLMILLKNVLKIFKNQSIGWLIMNLASLLLSARLVIKVSVKKGF